MSGVAAARHDHRLHRLIFGFLARFVMIALILVTLLQRYEISLVTRLLPAIAAEFEWLDDTYAIMNLTVDQEGADQVVRIVVSQARYIQLGDRVFGPDPRGRANASTLVGNITLPAVLLLAAALAWPVTHIRSAAADYALRGAFIPIALAMTWSLDAPFILWSAIWSLHVDTFAPGMFSPLLIWSQFLQCGGRDLLALLLGAAAALGARTLAQAVKMKRKSMAS